MRLNDIQMKKFQSIEKIFINLKKKKKCTKSEDIVLNIITQMLKYSGTIETES